MAKTVFEQIRSKLHDRLGIDGSERRDGVAQEVARMKSSLHRIVAIAEPRLVMGGIRYGSKWDHEPLMDYMQTKFDTFRRTGNFEMLVDLVNFCAIENVLKTHPNFHFKAIDRK